MISDLPVVILLMFAGAAVLATLVAIVPALVLAWRIWRRK